jgi:23S rRNA (adenine2503-C2)-methyltransferase
MDRHPVLSDSLPVLSGSLPEELAKTFSKLPAYRSRQIFKWISRGVSSFSEMSDLPLNLRESLENTYRLHSSHVSKRLFDADGTTKLQIVLEDGSSIEAVLLVDGEGRRTACISTQVGCPVGCVFCKTGSLGFLRNLNAAEIIEQFYHLMQLHSPISNIVIMGMGEPLLNLDALAKAIGLLTEATGLALSPRRITLSTSGPIAGIEELIARRLPLRLAVSITTADNELRSRLMPIGRANPLPALKTALLQHQAVFGKRISLEAVLLGGLNTRPADIKALIQFCQGLEVMVNLIPWNPVEGLCFEDRALQVPSAKEVAVFTHELKKAGIPVQRRMEKGQSVNGACGQLGNLNLKRP